VRIAGELKEGLRIGWAAIRANAMRSILATLGIVIGVVTVTLMGTAITGLKRAFVESISVIGADVLYVQRFDWFVTSHQDYVRMRKRNPITIAEAEALGRQLTSARALTPTAKAQLPVSYGKRRSESVFILGTTHEMANVHSGELTAGRFMNSAESEGGRPVCMIGVEVADNLFRGGTALGKKIRIGNATFEVIGVLGRQGSFLGLVSLDNQAVVPLRQFETHFISHPDYEIQVKAASLDQIDETAEELRVVMRRVRRLKPHEPDDFAINRQDQFTEMFNKVAGTIGAVGLFVTGLSLFVGGIGIMNIMFVSVAERTREIGIRKAIGAKRRTILLQFLIESAAICTMGGIIALAIAWPLTIVMSQWFPAAMSLPVAGLAIGVSLLTGVLSGIVPAWRAARLNPVDALRNE
jgi:putative ABC transport system permease protein